MKTLVSKDALNRMALCVCFLSALTNGLFGQKPLPIAQGAEPITITMTTDHWQTKENAEFLRQLGFYHGLMRLNSGDAVLKGIVQRRNDRVRRQYDRAGRTRNSLSSARRR